MKRKWDWCLLLLILKGTFGRTLGEHPLGRDQYSVQFLLTGRVTPLWTGIQLSGEGAQNGNSASYWERKNVGHRFFSPPHSTRPSWGYSLCCTNNHYLKIIHQMVTCHFGEFGVQSEAYTDPVKGPNISLYNYFKTLSLNSIFILRSRSLLR